MDLPCLRIWMQDAVAIAKVVLNGSERNTTWSPMTPFRKEYSTRSFSTRLLYQKAGKISTRLGFGAWAPHSLGASGSTWKTTRRTWRKAQKQPEGCSDYLKYSKTPHQVLDAYRTRLWRALGLIRPGAAGLLIGIECSRVRDSAWMYLTSLVATWIGVELAAVQRNYPTVL